MRFGDLVAAHRRARGLSQHELATLAAVSARTIGDLERGATRRPQRATVEALAGALALAGRQRVEFAQAARQAPPPITGRRAAAVAPPAPAEAIVGREADLAGVSRLLRHPGTRLVTVTGPAGVGKSRLAAAVGPRLAGSFRQLATIDPDAVTGRDLTGAITDLVDGREPVLAVLDGVGPDASPEVASLLARWPALHLLATGRGELRLRGEHLWPLSPLPVPAEPVGTDPADLQAVTGNPAVELLRQRVRLVRPGFAVSTGNLAAVVSLCRRLGGMPLAIELAAAQLRLREPAELDRELAHLGGAPVDEVDAAGRVSAVVRWRVGQLSTTDRRRLAVLAGLGSDPTPAQLRRALAERGMPAARLEASLTTLATAGLCTIVDDGGEVRLRLPGSVREVAAGGRAVTGRRAPHGPARQVARTRTARGS